METDTISKNGASPKSLMSRGIMFCLLSLIVLFFSCTIENTAEASASVSVSVVSPTSKSIIFDSGENTKEVILTCNIALTDSICPQWITIVKEGDKRRQVFHLTALKNESSNARTDSVMFSGRELTETASVTISVTQLGQQ